jgi:hypothetical protein
VKTRVWAAIAVVGLLAAGGLIMGREYRKWNERVEVALEFSARETARANALVEQADAERTRADMLAAEVAAGVANTRERIRVIRDTVIVPDTCRVFVIQRDSVIDELLAENEQLSHAYDLQRTAASRLRDSYDILLVANDSLRTVLEARPIPPPAWMPSIGVGAIGGMCTTGPCVGVGVSVSWKVRLPI